MNQITQRIIQLRKREAFWIKFHLHHLSIEDTMIKMENFMLKIIKAISIKKEIKLNTKMFNRILLIKMEKLINGNNKWEMETIKEK